MASRSLLGRNYAAKTLTAALLSCAVCALAQSGNNNKSQTVYLPDPTPRKMDNSLLLGEPTPPETSTPETVERRNARRRELVEWAANQLVTLSQRLEADVSKSPSADKSVDAKAAAANAARIELIARNLSAALKAQ
jgi:hypothetical protein